MIEFLPGSSCVSYHHVKEEVSGEHNYDETGHCIYCGRWERDDYDTIDEYFEAERSGIHK